MDTKKRSDFDDMSPNSFDDGLNAKRLRIIKIVVGILIVIFFAALITGIVMLINADPENPGETDTPQEQTAVENLAPLVDDNPLPETVDAILESALTDEQKTAIEETKKTFSDDTQEPAATEPTEDGVVSEAASVEDEETEPSTASDTDSDSENNDQTTESAVGAESETDNEEEAAAEAESDQEDTETADANGDDTILNTPIKYSDYIVNQGDTLNKIAAVFGLSPATIVSVNSITDANQVKVGDTLRIPDRDGQIYIVQSGDSLSMIAYSFDMGYVTLADVNGLASSLIHPGDTLFIPNKTISVEDLSLVMNTLFVIPAEGTVTAKFGQDIEDIKTGNMVRLQGIYIKNEVGTEISASRNGQIIYIGNNQLGLGKNLIIRHENGYETVYGHLDSFFVSEGDYVNQGDRIALMGSTGGVLDSTLYFEVRKDAVPIDPEQFF